jgi:hypothetical protein
LLLGGSLRKDLIKDWFEKGEREGKIKMVLKIETFQNLRTLYYVGIAIILLYVFPTTSKYMQLFETEVFSGLSIISLVAFLVGLGAFMAYNRKL